MNYHNIIHDDMLNGTGLRVTLFVSGCEHNCYGCQNSQTHSPTSGIKFDEQAIAEIFEQLNKPYISGITFSGGDPLHKDNISTISSLIREIRKKFPQKNIWLYTGYTYEELCNENKFNFILNNIDVLVDGRFDIELSDTTAHWVGSINQRVIDMQNTKFNKAISLYKEDSNDKKGGEVNDLNNKY